MKRFVLILGSGVAAVAMLIGGSGMVVATYDTYGHPLCDQNAVTCTEAASPYNYAGNYTGHDEPSVLFYSGAAGAGNSQVYSMTLPTDPPNPPNQNGTGGTFNFQLHPAFWFGMAMCDDQSGPNPGGSALVGPNIPCTANSDANIYDGATLSDPAYIGKHPGVAFMEMQFYPPGWVLWPAGDSCNATKWCAALNIDSLNQNQNTGAVNNAACLNSVGIEPVNFAFITRSGVAQAPANPVDATLATFTPSASKDLFMGSGDRLSVSMHDTSAGFQVVIDDLTSGQAGSMTASTANGFGHVIFDPSATSCTTDHAAFHPAYSSSSEHTRVPWAAHSYNVAFSDEIGHFEFCNALSGEQTSNCATPGVQDTGTGVDSDDNYCFAKPFSGTFFAETRNQVGGCLGSDSDYDGVPYQATWPGSTSNAAQEAAYHPSPILFSSPTTNGTSYDRVAFETDLPRIEIPSFSSTNSCNRTTGTGCVNPPLTTGGAQAFYPFFSADNSTGSCLWGEGGAYVPHNVYAGGSSTAEFGSLLFLTYPTPSGPSTRTNDFRNVLSSNPC